MEVDNKRTGRVNRSKTIDELLAVVIKAVFCVQVLPHLHHFLRISEIKN